MRYLLALVMIAALPACDVPWAGPGVPGGAQALDIVQLDYRGPIGIDFGPDIAASPSLTGLRQQVISKAMGHRPASDSVCTPDNSRPDPCWTQQPDVAGRLYVAVVTTPECNRAVKESAALGGHTLYFLHWIGKPDRVCNMAMARPSWRLFYVARKDLPASGTLTVRLQYQGEEQTYVETKADLT